MSCAGVLALAQRHRQNTPLAFAGAFDARRGSIDVRTILPLRHGFKGELETGYEYARYRYRNAVESLTGQSVATAVGPRRDHIASAAIALSKPINEHVSVELRWQGILQF